MAETIAQHKLRPPAIVIVGDVVAAEASDSQLAETWFTSRPLFGKRVLVTRPIGQADTLRRSLQELGADVLVQPVIEIQPPTDWRPVDKALQQLAQYDWLVFSSSNGVRMLLDRLAEIGGDLRSLHGVRLAAIGPATAEELAAYRLRADLVPPEFRAESLAEALATDASGKKFLLARANRGREVLAERLRAAGGTVEQVVVYRSTDVAAPQPDVADALQGGKIDWVTVTSSAIARSLAAMFGDALGRTRLASISPVTSDTLRELGLTPAAEAQEYTAPGLVEALLKACRPGTV